MCGKCALCASTIVNRIVKECDLMSERESDLSYRGETRGVLLATSLAKLLYTFILRLFLLRPLSVVRCIVLNPRALRSARSLLRTSHMRISDLRQFAFLTVSICRCLYASLSVCLSLYPLFTTHLSAHQVPQDAQDLAAEFASVPAPAPALYTL